MAMIGLPAASALPAGGHEGRRPPDAFDEQRDDAGLRVFDEVIDVVGEIEAHLVAAGDHVVEVHPAMRAHAGDVLHGAAGLGHERDRAGLLLAKLGIGIAEILLPHRIDAHAVGPADQQAGSVDQRLERRAACDDLGIVAFADLACIDGGALEPGGDAGFEDALHAGGRNDHEGMRRCLRQRGEVGIAFDAPHFAAARVHRIDFAREAVVAQVAIDLSRPFRALGGADDGDRGGPQKGQGGLERDFAGNCSSNIVSSDPGLH